MPPQRSFRLILGLEAIINYISIHFSTSEPLGRVSAEVLIGTEPGIKWNAAYVLVNPTRVHRASSNKARVAENRNSKINC